MHWLILSKETPSWIQNTEAWGEWQKAAKGLEVRPKDGWGPLPALNLDLLSQSSTFYNFKMAARYAVKIIQHLAT